MMQFANQKVLITGGATGIGEGIAKYLIDKGAHVTVCGRREEALKAFKASYPMANTIQIDVSKAADRKKLIEAAGCNILINNAGIQKSIDLKKDEFDGSEIDINFTAVVHLCMLFGKYVETHKVENAAIINVSSGLSFVQKVTVPVYCATKAALHSFTLSLRHQYRDFIKVIELCPPAIDTDLQGPGLHKFGCSVSDFINGTLPRIEKGELEVGFGMSEAARNMGPEELKEFFDKFNQ